MTLHRILAELGIVYTTPKDGEMHIAKYISERFQKAAAVCIEKKFREGKSIGFIDCLKVVWKEGHEGTSFNLVDAFLQEHFPEVCGPVVRLTKRKTAQRGNVLHRGDEFIRINIHTGHLEAAQTEAEFKKEFHVLVATIYHECDHIFVQGAFMDQDTYEKTFLYLTQKGEIRAHSKEYAWLYHQAFPGVAFDFNKMKDLFETAYGNSSGPANTLSHLEVWKDPEHYQTNNKKVKEFIENRIVQGSGVLTVDKCKKAYEAYIHFMEYFVNYFNSNEGHKIEL